MRVYIDHYCIMMPSQIDGQPVFFTGYKTLTTLKKMLALYRSMYPSAGFFLAARDYDRNIIKIYDL